MGGQTALNMAVELAEKGILDKYGVKESELLSNLSKEEKTESYLERLWKKLESLSLKVKLLKA